MNGDLDIWVSQRFLGSSCWLVHGPGPNRQPKYAYCLTEEEANNTAAAIRNRLREVLRDRDEAEKALSIELKMHLKTKPLLEQTLQDFRDCNNDREEACRNLEKKVNWTDEISDVNWNLFLKLKKERDEACRFLREALDELDKANVQVSPSWYLAAAALAALEE